LLTAGGDRQDRIGGVRSRVDPIMQMTGGGRGPPDNVDVRDFILAVTGLC
jgi:hypothetical protein